MLAPHVVAEAVFVMQVWLQVLVQSIEPSLSSENVVIAGGGLTDAEAASGVRAAAVAKPACSPPKPGPWARNGTVACQWGQGRVRQ